MDLISSRQLFQASAVQGDGWTIKDHAKHTESLCSHHACIPLAKESCSQAQHGQGNKYYLTLQGKSQLHGVLVYFSVAVTEPGPKPSWGMKEFTWLKHPDHREVRAQAEAGIWRQELMQRPWRKARLQA